MRLLFDETASSIPPESGDEPLAETYAALETALKALRTNIAQLLNWLATSPESAVAGATNYHALWQLRRCVTHCTASHNRASPRFPTPLATPAKTTTSPWQCSPRTRHRPIHSGERDTGENGTFESGNRGDRE